MFHIFHTSAAVTVDRRQWKVEEKSRVCNAKYFQNKNVTAQHN